MTQMHAKFAEREPTLTTAEKVAELRRLLKKAERWADSAESDLIYNAANELVIAYRGQLQGITR